MLQPSPVWQHEWKSFSIKVFWFSHHILQQKIFILNKNNLHVWIVDLLAYGDILLHNSQFRRKHVKIGNLLHTQQNSCIFSSSSRLLLKKVIYIFNKLYKRRLWHLFWNLWNCDSVQMIVVFVIFVIQA